MADSLGAVLAGIENGVGNGLNIYKTLRDDERASREERRLETRQAIDDQRWSLGHARTARLDERDLANDKLLQEDRVAGRDLQERTLKFKQEEALRDNADAERRHQEAMVLSRQRLNAATAKNRIAANKQLTTIYDGMNKELGAVFQGENGMRNFTELANTKPTYLAAIARKLGGDISPDDLQGVTATMGRNKDGEVLFMLSKKDADGKDTMWDPDGDGQPGYAVSARAVSGMYGGINGIESVDTATTKVSLADGAERVASGIEGQEAPLKARLSKRTQAVQQAQRALELETSGPRAEFIRQQEGARANAEVSQLDGTRTFMDPSSGKKITVASGMAATGDAGYPALNKARADQRAGVAQASASLGNAIKEQFVTEQRLAQVPKKAAAVREGWSGIERAVSALPFAQQKDALRASAETFNVSPQLAARYPGKNPVTATDLMRKDRTAFIDKLVGAVDQKTSMGSDGKLRDLTGGKANLRAVLTAMGDETLMALSDYTGSLEGSLQKAAQKALEIGKPEAVPYILYADANALDSAGAVALMQEKGLMDVKDPKKRFELAAEAMDLVKAGKADTPVAALGMVLQGR